MSMEELGNGKKEKVEFHGETGPEAEVLASLLNLNQHTTSELLEEGHNVETGKELDLEKLNKIERDAKEVIKAIEKYKKNHPAQEEPEKPQE